ncbi:MAG: hypothetical protein GX820_05935 [Bacteroidales bacterium]|nr:hypothetical protein [Bacteroidales bacterium]
MKTTLNQTGKIYIISIFFISVFSAYAENPDFIRLSGSASEIGNIWGMVNARAIKEDMDRYYLSKASEKGITAEELIERSSKFISIVEKIAPHWLTEARAIADKAGVNSKLYISFIANVYRNLFIHECTSYAVSYNYTDKNAVYFHKNRDNVEKAQAAFIYNPNIEGINKFIAVSDASALCCMMMVNDKGLAGSADYPGSNGPEEAPKNYRGIMNTFMLRYIAEKASNCNEALQIIEDFTKKGYYAGGDVDETHWLFVDKSGTILEVSNNFKNIISKRHNEKVYFSRLENSNAARKLNEIMTPVTFEDFHFVSRDPSICLNSSISGMTVEIHPKKPHLLTCAWISLPARSVSIPILMGGERTPRELIDGNVYKLAKNIDGNNDLWESIEESLHQHKELFINKIKYKNHSESGENPFDLWNRKQSELIIKILQKLQN